ncbi:YciI family protein [Amycolatopsis anabasis]|uniref:YciI family protein n=1 Tax=Amycolatopsis anabasis TaxID=1840409 RepID=UPI00131DC41B|nr:YciI family protein [Amycolatopsis anabasis]
MRYMLLVYGCARHPEGSAELDAKRTAVAEFEELCEERGVFLAADPLHGTETATTVRVRDGETMVVDGPFAETREQLGGYYLLDCRDLDEAMELAARCPMAAEGSIEIRPVLERA